MANKDDYVGRLIVRVSRRTFFTARCTIVQSAVLRSHVVRVSVRLSVLLSVCDVGGFVIT